MVREVKPPEEFAPHLKRRTLSIFLGGSIEMGTAKPWQKRVVAGFKGCQNVVILNPRRDNWNSSWKQSKKNKDFRCQVQWELFALEEAKVILMYFDPATKAPISLLELGLFAFATRKRECQGMGMDSSYWWEHRKMLVVCPNGYWRKGNVDIVCERYSIPQFTSLTAAIKHIKANARLYR